MAGILGRSNGVVGAGVYEYTTRFNRVVLSHSWVSSYACARYLYLFSETSVGAFGSYPAIPTSLRSATTAFVGLPPGWGDVRGLIGAVGVVGLATRSASAFSTRTARPTFTA